MCHMRQLKGKKTNNIFEYQLYLQYAHPLVTPHSSFINPASSPYLPHNPPTSPYIPHNPPTSPYIPHNLTQMYKVPCQLADDQSLFFLQLTVHELLYYILFTESLNVLCIHTFPSYRLIGSYHCK